MSLKEQLLGILHLQHFREVNEWTKSNLDAIVQGAEREYERMIENLKPDMKSTGKSDIDAAATNRVLRNLSEMPLCSAWFYNMPCQPPSFKLCRGKMINLATGYHVYAASGDGENPEILCFFFGQFYDLQYPGTTTTFKAGDRVSKYQQMAPGLVTCYPELGIARLYGRKNDISAKLGLNFGCESDIRNSINRRNFQKRYYNY